MRFEYVAPENIRTHWPRVEAGLERILVTSNETWIAADIYCHIKIKAAQLYLAFDGDEYRGFFLFEIKPDVFTNALYLNIWALHGEPKGEGHFADVGQFVGETVEFIERLARTAGAKEIRMSGRRGWERFLHGMFEPIRVSFVRKLS